jgi:hypothetical protein
MPVLSFHLRLALPSDRFPSGFPTKHCTHPSLPLTLPHDPHPLPCHPP